MDELSRVPLLLVAMFAVAAFLDCFDPASFMRRTMRRLLRRGPKN